MSIKASEISDLIKARIEKFQSAAEARNVGTVVSVTDGIVRVPIDTSVAKAVHGDQDHKYTVTAGGVDDSRRVWPVL